MIFSQLDPVTVAADPVVAATPKVGLVPETIKNISLPRGVQSNPVRPNPNPDLVPIVTIISEKSVVVPGRGKDLHVALTLILLR